MFRASVFGKDVWKANLSIIERLKLRWSISNNSSYNNFLNVNLYKRNSSGFYNGIRDYICMFYYRSVDRSGIRCLFLSTLRMRWRHLPVFYSPGNLGENSVRGTLLLKFFSFYPFSLARHLVFHLEMFQIPEVVFITWNVEVKKRIMLFLFTRFFSSYEF